MAGIDKGAEDGLCPIEAFESILDAGVGAGAGAGDTEDRTSAIDREALLGRIRTVFEGTVFEGTEFEGTGDL